MPIQTLQRLEKEIQGRIRLFGQRSKRFNDDVRFLRSWFERPLVVGAISPSGKVLARTMANFVDPGVDGPIIELGPGTGPVTAAMVERGIDPARLVMVEFDPAFCKILRARYPTATVVQGDAYELKRTLDGVLTRPAAALVSGLPLMTKPLRTRLHLVHQAFAMMLPGAPFVQFTYATVSPIPRTLSGIAAQSSGRIWKNFPPARVWVYRKN
jgi:phosphatidylethanolamine/phosphatidyl-N-methylethanolamine N-methyltransferase